jgi:tRNA(fMet)-specific endonuclease VapC
MSLRFLLDTNILSEPLKLEPNAAVIEQMERYQSEVAITSVTWHEIWFGCYRLPASKKRQRIERYLRDIVEPDVPILPYGAEPALWFAQERSRLVSLGRTPSFADGQIAAIAYTHNLVLITNNVSDYADFQNLQIENWFS